MPVEINTFVPFPRMISVFGIREVSNMPNISLPWGIAYLSILLSNFQPVIDMVSEPASLVVRVMVDGRESLGGFILEILTFPR